MTDFDGKTYEAEHDKERLSRQFGRVRALVLDGQWRTLNEIGKAVDAPPASVSTRLRDLRKARFGSYIVERRRRGLPRDGLFEYRVITQKQEESQEELFNKEVE